MIKLGINTSGSLVIIQQSTAPSVYLDNWALMDIACNKNTTDLFIKILKKHNGTLEFSGMNLLELSLIEDLTQIKAIEEFLDNIIPNLSFIDMIPQNVIDRENRILNAGEQIPPHWDPNLLRFYATMYRDSLTPLSAKGFFTHLRQSEIIDACRTFMQGFKNLVEEKRQIVKTNPEYQYAVSRIPSGKPMQRATRYIYQDIVNSLIRDNIDMGNSKNWCDFFHTVVPIAYCNFVLLDRTWAHKAKEVIKRLRKTGQSAEMAKIFAKQNMDLFWKEFENKSN